MATGATADWVGTLVPKMACGHFPPSEAGELSKAGQVLEHPHLNF